jgi:putative hemolysin
VLDATCSACKVLRAACSAVTVLHQMVLPVGAEATTSMHERSAAAKFKFTMGEMEHIHCAKKGTHPFNRQIMEEKVHDLCTTFLVDGWDSDEEGGTVVQEEPGKKVILQHNLNMVVGSVLLPQIDEEQEKLLVYGTLDHGHQNWACRLIHSGKVRCGHPEHTDSAGFISMNVASSRRPRLAEKI